MIVFNIIILVISLISCIVISRFKGDKAFYNMARVFSCLLLVSALVGFLLPEEKWLFTISSGILILIPYLLIIGVAAIYEFPYWENWHLSYW